MVSDGLFEDEPCLPRRCLFVLASKRPVLYLSGIKTTDREFHFLEDRIKKGKEGLVTGSYFKWKKCLLDFLSLTRKFDL